MTHPALRRPVPGLTTNTSLRPQDEFEHRTRETPGRRAFEEWLKKKANDTTNAALKGEDERVRTMNAGYAVVWRELVELFCKR